MEDERGRREADEREADEVIEVIVVGEGQTEETFVRDVLAPQLTNRDISLQPRLIHTSERGRGGSLSPDRVLRFLRNTLRQRGDTYVTTFFDLYRLSADFPGVAAARLKTDPLQRCHMIEEGLAEAAIRESGCRADRFFPHIQPFEFEALLFSDVVTFGSVQSEWRRFVDELQLAREGADTPEHINGGADTHPSVRLKTLLQPKYIKPLHGSRIATSIGLARIRTECRHFDSWLTRIESIKPLR
jgi:hypothetical protein